MDAELGQHLALHRIGGQISYDRLCRCCYGIDEHARHRQQFLEPVCIKTTCNGVGNVETNNGLHTAGFGQTGDVQYPDRGRADLRQGFRKLIGSGKPRCIMIGQDNHVAPGQRPEIRPCQGFAAAHPGYAGVVREASHSLGAFLALADQHCFVEGRQHLRQAIEWAFVRDVARAPNQTTIR